MDVVRLKYALQMRTMNIFKTKVGGNFGLSFTDHRLPMVAGDVVEPFENRKMNEIIIIIIIINCGQ